MRLRDEQDRERLRMAALLLESENARLVQKNLELQKRLMFAEGASPDELQLRLAELERQLARQTQKIVGPSSERRDGPVKDAAPKPKQEGHGPRQQTLEVVERIHHLDAPDEMCPQCGGQLVEWAGQLEEAEEVDVIQRRFVMVKHRRQKYRCSCQSYVETAPAPPKLIPGGRYSIDFAISVAIAKYLDHAPLERQVRAMKREGLICDSQTLWDQLEALARVLNPLGPRLHQYVLQHPLIGADETSWRLMDKKGSKRWTVWTLCADDAVYYRLTDNKRKEVALDLLLGYRGVVEVDGSSTYVAVQRIQGGFALSNCGAHARRRFVEAEENFPVCKTILDLYGELYQVEKEAPSGREGDAQRKKLRQEKSKPITNKMLAWALETRGRALPESALGQAIRYLLNHWEGLIAFLNDPRIPLDNNATERAQRGIVLGRKNHYGSRSKRGTEVAALIYALIESCKLVGVDPAKYLRAAVDAALGGETIPLPHEYAAQLKKAA